MCQKQARVVATRTIAEPARVGPITTGHSASVTTDWDRGDSALPWHITHRRNARQPPRLDTGVVIRR